MKLYFLRHADAVPGSDDAARELSPLGRRQARVLAAFLKSAGIEFDAAYSSPLVRARQTAEIVLKHTDSVRPRDLQIADALLNEASGAEFSRWLRRLPEARNVLLVGHEPSLPERVAALLGAGDSRAFSMSKGAITCIRTEEGETPCLKFSIPPSVLEIE